MMAMPRGTRGDLPTLGHAAVAAECLAEVVPAQPEVLPYRCLRSVGIPGAQTYEEPNVAIYRSAQLIHVRIDTGDVAMVTPRWIVAPSMTSRLRSNIDHDERTPTVGCGVAVCRTQILGP